MLVPAYEVGGHTPPKSTTYPRDLETLPSSSGKNANREGQAGCCTSRGHFNTETGCSLLPTKILCSSSLVYIFISLCIQYQFHLYMSALFWYICTDTRQTLAAKSRPFCCWPSQSDRPALVKLWEVFFLRQLFRLLTMSNHCMQHRNYWKCL